MPRSLGSSQVTLRSPIQISPRVDLEQAGDRVQKRGLAAARRAEQHEKLAVLDLEVQAVEDADAAEGDADLAYRDPGHAAQPLTAPAAMPRTNQRPGDEIDDQRHEAGQDGRRHVDVVGALALGRVDDVVELHGHRQVVAAGEGQA